MSLIEVPRRQPLVEGVDAGEIVATELQLIAIGIAVVERGRHAVIDGEVGFDGGRRQPLVRPEQIRRPQIGHCDVVDPAGSRWRGVRN
jgi:hypothetical protein